MEHIRGNGRLLVTDQNVEDVRLSFGKKSSPKYKTTRLTLELIPIDDPANSTQLFAIIPMQDAEPEKIHRLEQDEMDELGAKLSK